MARSERTSGNGNKLKLKRFCLSIKKHSEGDWGLVQVSQEGCGVSILGDIQKPPECSPGQLAAGGHGPDGPDDFQRFLPTLFSVFMWFCDSKQSPDGLWPPSPVHCWEPPVTSWPLKERGEKGKSMPQMWPLWISSEFNYKWFCFVLLCCFVFVTCYKGNIQFLRQQPFQASQHIFTGYNYT